MLKILQQPKFQCHAFLAHLYICVFFHLFWQVGDRVIALTDFKAWAELVSVSANTVYKIPDNMSFHDGAALLMNYITAYVLLFDLANLRKGQSLLIHSAAGGVVSTFVDGLGARNTP